MARHMGCWRHSRRASPGVYCGDLGLITSPGGRMGRLSGRLFVGCTTALICFISYSPQIFVVWPWYGSELSTELLSLIIPFNILVGMLLWNYCLSVVTDPGRIPPSWEPDLQDQDGYEVKRLTSEPRYCRTCESYKPPRAHHCWQCKRCVLRMGHHCSCINNCIGHFNYGHFIRFLFYVDLACVYHFAMLTRRVYVATHGRHRVRAPRCRSVVVDSDTCQDFLSGKELVFVVLNYVTCIPVLLVVGGLSLYHFRDLLNNTTTIERWEKNQVAILIRHGRIREVKFPYNLGMKRNIMSVLGNNPLYWCWPAVPPGTGLKYQIVVADDPDEFLLHLLHTARDRSGVDDESRSRVFSAHSNRRHGYRDNVGAPVQWGAGWSRQPTLVGGGDSAPMPAEWLNMVSMSSRA
ncbi:hypothetical protein CERSUDRAFT_116907 [Gelatoporia subvermispora B]|uniref:Palmitoyltransferase n=1 Tax=Ceriporiopsis subvermispora (strain B) TaxID=914234 RepID=M2QRA1_CERS8|nr:hypothetical protein CERSUDRAFT_116907 [Gelatoporia subvermispora B]